jgi:uncharacterized protein (DUF302 family)
MSETRNDHGVVTIASEHSCAVTMQRLETLLKERGVTIFARIDFSGDAERVGLDLRAEQMLIFGNPKAGTPLMAEAAVSGLDLPIKALVWEDAGGKTWIAYNDPEYIVKRHNLSPALAANLAAALPLVKLSAAK